VEFGVKHVEWGKPLGFDFEKISRGFEEIGNKTDESANPGSVVEVRLAVLEQKVDEEKGKNEIEDLVFESLKWMLGAGGEASADVPMENVIFEIVGGKNEGNTDGRVRNFGGDVGSSGGMGKREHRG